MKIYNKIESMKKINELKLNRFPEQLFKCGEENKVLQFIDKYPAKYYAIRDRSKPRGVFKFTVLKEDVLEEIKEYEIFSINVSSFNYSNQLLVGEIEFLDNDEIYLCAFAGSGISDRELNLAPTFNFKTNIFDKRLNKVPYFDKLFKLIVDNNLINVIVEFAIFDENVGINDDNIIIYELRTEY